MKTKAQSAIEYAVLITVIVLAVVAMNAYVMRSVNANLKSTEEQTNNLNWTLENASPGPGPGPEPEPEPVPEPAG